MALISKRPRPARVPHALGRTVPLGFLLLTLVSAAAFLAPPDASAQDQFVGEIRAFPFNFAPKGWTLCQGQLLPISQNTALFSLLGTTFGGDGKSTFALPDLRGRISIGEGQGPGLSLYDLGENGGEEYHTLTVAEMPAHTHAEMGDGAPGTDTKPQGLLHARNAAGMPQYGRTPSVQMSPQSLGPAGGGQPHENRPPFLTLNYCIAQQGIYPPRSAPQAQPRHVAAPPVTPAKAK